MFEGIFLAIQGAASQGIIWGIMTLGVYITFKVLDFPDLTVDGSFALGGAVSAILISNGMNPFITLIFSFLAGSLAGLATGILNTKGVQKLKIGDWSTGENPYIDIVKAINMIREKGIVGRIVLALSQGLFFDLQRIQQGTGMTEAQRITNMIHNLYNIPTIKGKKAAIICVEPQYIDLAIGVDMSTAYLEQKDLNHTFRITETVLPRIKEPEAIVVLE